MTCVNKAKQLMDQEIVLKGLKQVKEKKSRRKKKEFSGQFLRQQCIYDKLVFEMGDQELNREMDAEESMDLVFNLLRIANEYILPKLLGNHYTLLLYLKINWNRLSNEVSTNIC